MLFFRRRVFVFISNAFRFFSLSRYSYNCIGPVPALRVLLLLYFVAEYGVDGKIIMETRIRTTTTTTAVFFVEARGEGE